MNKSWNLTLIKTDNLQQKYAIAPVIISASRCTDIPAFYSEWFFNRLQKGYTAWINPFNRKIQYISFEKTRVIVFWSKNPKPIISKLKILDEKNINYYFHFTINDYEKEGLEPNLPSLEDRINTFIELSEKIGKEKVIWRFDPLIITNNINVDRLIDKIYLIGEKLINYTDKLVFSFVDISRYRKVRLNIKKELNYINKKSYFADIDDIEKLEFTEETKYKFARRLKDIIKFFRNKNPSFTVATCAEEIDLREYDIHHNSCIDGALLAKLFPQDKKLMEFLGVENKTDKLLNENSGMINSKIEDRLRFYNYPDDLNAINKKLKDKGQRKECGCIMSKDIGSYNTCGHLCVYCYANHSRNIVENNIRFLKENIMNNSESIL